MQSFTTFFYCFKIWPSIHPAHWSYGRFNIMIFWYWLRQIPFSLIFSSSLLCVLNYFEFFFFWKPLFLWSLKKSEQEHVIHDLTVTGLLSKCCVKKIRYRPWPWVVVLASVVKCEQEHATHDLTVTGDLSKWYDSWRICDTRFDWDWSPKQVLWVVKNLRSTESWSTRVSHVL